MIYFFLSRTVPQKNRKLRIKSTLLRDKYNSLWIFCKTSSIAYRGDKLSKEGTGNPLFFSQTFVYYKELSVHFLFAIFIYLYLNCVLTARILFDKTINNTRRFIFRLSFVFPKRCQCAPFYTCIGNNCAFKHHVLRN